MFTLYFMCRLKYLANGSSGPFQAIATEEWYKVLTPVTIHYITRQDNHTCKFLFKYI